MPIIKDPKMNPREKEFGLVYVEGYKAHLKYFKKRNSENRRLAAGSWVEFDEKKNKITLYEDQIIIEGMIVVGEVKGDFENKTSIDDAPVIFWLRDNGTDSLTESIMDDLIGDQSNVPI